MIPRFLAILLAAMPLPGLGREPVLDTITAKVQEAYNKQQQPVVIFDLEGTLFDNRPRIHKILHEYAETELKGVRPEFAAAILKLPLERVRYLLTDTLKEAQVTEQLIINNAAVFWSQRFFSDDYLQYDTPTPGAVAFIRSLYSTGARIVYLTGRDAPRQLLGTVKMLRDHGFPIGIQGSELIMKPTQQTQDAVFKQNVTNYLRQFGTVIATFDNEPANANIYRRAYASATCVLFDAPGSPNPPPLLPEIQKLRRFE